MPRRADSDIDAALGDDAAMPERPEPPLTMAYLDRVSRHRI